MATLLLAEHDNMQLSEATARTLTAALALGAPVHVLVAGDNCRAVAEAAATLQGVEKGLLADAPHYSHALAEPVAALLVQLAAGYDALAAPATAKGKNIMPRAAALLDAMQVSDIVAVNAPDTFERLIYAGNACQRVQVVTGKTVLTVRIAAFAPAPAGGNASIEAVQAGPDPALSAVETEEFTASARPPLAAARIVVSGGRALGSTEKFDAVIGALADRLGAAVGASRAAVDAGYAPNDCQVGQTGKIVAPELYVAIGISGAIQHLAGMKDSKVIVAINRDGDAPIFQLADYGLVGDLFEIVPEFERQLAELATRRGAGDTRTA